MLLESLNEQGAPAADESYLNNADNLDILKDGIDQVSAEYSTLNGGLDRTIALQRTFNPLTNKFNDHIVTQNDENEWTKSKLHKGGYQLMKHLIHN